MHEHEDQGRRDPFRPPAGRLEPDGEARVAAAAGSGRSDALSVDDVLGLQRHAGNQALTAILQAEAGEQGDDGGTSPVHDVIARSGRPLEEGVRAEMEGRMGHDFSDVRVHDDAASADSAAAVNAHAYTVGSNIVFQRDRYDPSSEAGKTTLAHELTHVVQQRNGPVDGTAAPGGISVSDPSDRFEREASANAERVMSVAASVQLDAAPGPSLQRDGELDEEVPDLQGLFIQRDEEDEELT